MKAIWKEGGKYFVDYKAELPPLHSYAVLIEIKACALSEVDDEVMKLLYKTTPQQNFPVGQDISGIVKEVGPGVSTLEPGDEVVGIIPLDYGISGCAEFCVLHEFDVTKKPPDVSFVDAAGSIGDAVKAYTALHYLGRMSRGDTVLIMDGASSFGSLLVQMALHWGAKVITTSATEDERLYLDSLDPEIALIIDMNKRHYAGKNLNEGGSLLLSACMEESGGLGVDLVIDNGVSQYTSEEYKRVTNDNYGYPVPTVNDIICALAVGGRWITSKQNLQLDPPNSRVLYLKCASIGYLFHHAWTLSSTQQGRYLHILMDIMEKISHEVVRPNIHHTIPFDSVVDTLKRLPEVRVGKVVLKFD